MGEEKGVVECLPKVTTLFFILKGKKLSETYVKLLKRVMAGDT